MRQVNEDISDVSILYALLSTSVSGMVNPIIYGLCDASFRRGYRRLFHILCNIKQMAPVTGMIHFIFVFHLFHKEWDYLS